jgi:hypothetical protein
MSKLPVQFINYITNCNFRSNKKITSVYIEQKGLFRLKPFDKFKKIKGHQKVNLNKASFCWQGKSGILTITDKFENKTGLFTVKAFGLITLTSSNSFEITHGQLQRFLAESVWYPSFFFNNNLSFNIINKQTVEVMIKNNNITPSVTFCFTDNYFISEIKAKRYMNDNGKFNLTDWQVIIKNYKKFHNILIPEECEIHWKTINSSFCWYKFKVINICYSYE